MLHFLNKWWRNTFIVRYFNIKKGVIFNILDCLVVETVVLLESSEISVVLKLLPRMPSTVWAKSKRKKTPQKANKLTTDALRRWMMNECSRFCHRYTGMQKTAAHQAACHLLVFVHHNICELNFWILGLINQCWLRLQSFAKVLWKQHCVTFLPYNKIVLMLRWPVMVSLSFPLC